MAGTDWRHRRHVGDDLICLLATIMSRCRPRPQPIIAVLLSRLSGFLRCQHHDRWTVVLRQRHRALVYTARAF